MSELRDAVSMMKSYDNSPFYRMEATFHRTVCDPIGTGYIGISHSSSTMNTPALVMLHQLGYAFGGNYTKYDGTTFMTDALFDIKYVMDKTGDTTYVGSRVKIPEEYHENLLKNCRFSSEEIPIVSLAIATGTPLPKGHGDLIDRNEIEYMKAIHDLVWGKITSSECATKIKYSAPTIIEADEVEE
jgi:uncharacterized membrane protein YfhO